MDIYYSTVTTLPSSYLLTTTLVIQHIRISARHLNESDDTAGDIWTDYRASFHIIYPILCSHFIDMLFVALLTFLLPLAVSAASSIPISVPPSPSTRNVVGQNFLGISFELSAMTLYCELFFLELTFHSHYCVFILTVGNDTLTIPPAIINYLPALRSQMGNNFICIRVGGNSMDTSLSLYVPTQTSPMIQLVNDSSNLNDQPDSFFCYRFYY